MAGTRPQRFSAALGLLPRDDGPELGTVDVDSAREAHPFHGIRDSDLHVETAPPTPQPALSGIRRQQSWPAG